MKDIYNKGNQVVPDDDGKMFLTPIGPIGGYVRAMSTCVVAPGS
jgi:hypothetical protein